MIKTIDQLKAVKFNQKIYGRRNNYYIFTPTGKKMIDNQVAEEFDKIKLKIK